MRYSIYFISLFVFLSFSCKEKNCAEAAVSYPGFIDSLNQELRRNTYFGIDSVKWVRWSVDTIRPFFGPGRNAGIKYANIHDKIHYDTVRTSLSINFYPNLKREEIENVKDLYLMEKKFENLSVYIELDNFFCTIILDDTLGENTFTYLQNVKIAVLKEYIKSLIMKRASE